MILNELLTFSKEVLEIQEQHKLLLAVSGGMDSMALAWLMGRSEFQFGIAHCNFRLRHSASDEDEALVKGFAAELQVPFYLQRFDTKTLAKNDKSSIQLIARNLRYDWLEKIREQYGYDYIATAHHINDSIETVIYNLAKGTGLRGLCGIPAKNGRIIRPLLFATRQQIHRLVTEHQIPWREDISNTTRRYARNKIRHQIVPVLKGINPQLEKSVRLMLRHLNDTKSLYEWSIQKVRSECLTARGPDYRLCFDCLKQFPAPETTLYELLKPFNFSRDQIGQMAKNRSRTGKEFFSESHRALTDRGCLLITDRKEQCNDHYQLQGEAGQLTLKHGTLRWQTFTRPPEKIPTAQNIALLDFHHLQFPLQLRRWRAGDQFQPLGMQGHHQKLQDFFSDRKLSRLEKERIWLLESAGTICWIVNYRIDERFKIRPDTEAYLQLTWTAAG